MPHVALTHSVYNRAANTMDFRKANAPGSKNEKREAAGHHNQQVLGEQQAQAAARAEEIRYNTTPQSAQEEYLSRRRAASAKSELGTSASTQLTTSTLG